MDLLDVTLRDGGFTNDFNWPIEFAKQYYELASTLDTKFIELGYWKQTQKSKNTFYNLDFDSVRKITQGKSLKNVSIIIDYHYCSKNLKDYPTDAQEEIGIIRLTARKDLIKDSILFANNLRKETNLPISFNIFNISNYLENELDMVVESILKADFQYIYFADTHGNLNLNDSFEMFETKLKTIKKSGIKTGIHLHDHLGRAYSNYEICKKSGLIDMCDASFMGIGKGAGNLKLENILDNENSIKIASFLEKNKELFIKKDSQYFFISSQFGVTDNYGSQAISLNLDIDNFVKFCKTIKGTLKDNFDKKIMQDFITTNISNK